MTEVASMKKNPGWIRRLSQVVLAHRRDVMLAVLTSVFGMLVQVAIPLIERRIVDRVMVAHRSGASLLAISIVTLSLGSFGLSFVRRYFGGKLALDVQHDLRSMIFSHLQRLDFARHDQLQTGQLVSRANSDVGLVQGLLSFLPLMTGNLVMLVVSLIVMLIISTQLALIELAAVPIMAVISISLRKKFFPAAYDAQQREGDVAVVVEEAVAGVRIVKGFGQEKAMIDRFSQEALSLFRSSVRETKIQSTLQSSLSFVPNVVQGLILFVGGYLALHGHLSVGTFLVFFSYIVQLGAPVRQLSVLISFSQQARAGVERIFELLDANPLVTNVAHPQEFPASPSLITFESVEFGYQKDRSVLNGLDLVIESGKTTAVVGLSGSGKSTLALLIPRFYDVTSGSISIGGIDIRSLDVSELRRHIGVVFEESFLFSDTIGKNISYGHLGATVEEIETAARRAGAFSFIDDLPNRFDTVVGEAGITLSGGQRQRIALARALITDPEILILDDATSAVDAGTESEINDSLREFAKHRTVIVIAHRRSTLSLASEIVVLSGGKVEARGTHEELLVADTIYQRLVSSKSDVFTEDLSEESLVNLDKGLNLYGLSSAGSPNGIVPKPIVSSRISHRVSRSRSDGPMGAALSATPELLALLDSLPLENLDPGVDFEELTTDSSPFSFRHFLRPFRSKLFVGLVLVGLDTALSLSGPSLIRLGIDRGVINKSFDAVVLVAMVYLAVAIADYVVVFGQQRVSGITSQRVLYALRLRIFSHLQRLGLSYYESEMAGRIMTRMTTDIDALSNLLQTGLVNAVVNILSFFGVAVVMVVINWRLSVAALYVLIPFGLATVWFQRASSRAYRVARERIAVVNSNLQEGLSGIRVTQAFSREENDSENFDKVSRGYRDARMTAQRLVALYFPFVLFLSDLASASVLWYGSHLVNISQLSVGAAIAFTLYIDQLFAPVQQLSQTFDQWQQAQVAIGQISKLLNIQTDIPEPSFPQELVLREGCIKFDHVNFSYNGKSSDALEDLSFEIQGGETVALVGQTGAGKSTIMKLIARLYDPTRGSITVDGVDLRRTKIEDYRRLLGYVPQEPFLFSGTVEQNIAFARNDATLDEVEAAATAVGASSFIEELPGAYQYEVTERGRALSLGQRQLIALARAYLARPKILLLDEATANLDLSTERKVTDALRVVTVGRTCVMIAHRLESARLADRILVLDQGKVVETGSHDELISRLGLYSTMWNSYQNGITSNSNV